MADNVRVQFSASIGALMKGVEDTKRAIASVSGEPMEVRLNKNLQNEPGPVAEALHALGLSAKSLLGLPYCEQVNRIMDALADRHRNGLCLGFETYRVLHGD